MKISIRVRPKGSVHYTGATLNAPDTSTKEQLERIAAKWVKENCPDHEAWFWKVFGR